MADTAQTIITILQTAPQLEAGIIALINTVSANSDATTAVTIDQYFANLSDDEKAYLANQAEIAADAAANAPASE